MPIRGKILNCLKADYPRIFKSDIITDLVKVLGCGVEIKSAHNKNIESLPISSHLNKLYNIQEIYKKLKEININNISFSYGRSAIIESGNGRIAKGDFVAIRGISGIGKSTLMQILLGVFKPTEGFVVLEFDDEEMELLEEQFKQIQDVAGMETIEDYIYYATMSHCKTMQAASKMFGQSGDIEKLMADENVHVGVVNMPIQLSNVEDKDEFSRYLNDVLNDAVKDFMNRNNEPLN